MNDQQQEKLQVDPYRILLIGWNSTHVRAYIQELIGAGHKVFWCGHQAHEIKGLVGWFDMEKLPAAASIHDGNSVGYRPFKVESLLDMLGGWKMAWDVILHFDDWNIPSDFHKLHIPYIYYCSELFFPVVPGIADYVLTPSYAAMELLMKKYKNKYKFAVLPWAIRYEMLGQSPHFEKERDIPCSFAGKVHAYKFYEQRQQMLPALADLIPGFEGHWYRPAEGLEAFDPGFKFKVERGKGQLDGLEYTNLLLNSKFGINFPTLLGPNFRDYEVPGCGAILLTLETQDHHLAGFEDGVNCYYFKTVEDVLEIVNERYDKDLAVRAWEWIQQENTYHDRYLVLQEMLDNIL